MGEVTLREAIRRSPIIASLRRRRLGNDEGTYGEFTFDVAERTIGLEYNERYFEITVFEWFDKNLGECFNTLNSAGFSGGWLV